MVIVIIAILIILNNFVLETFYLYSKQKDLMNVYGAINKYYSTPNSQIDIELELEKAAINNNFDIIIKTDTGISIFTSNKDFSTTIGKINEIESSIFSWFGQKNVLYSNDKITIRRTQDLKNGLNYVLLSGNLDNGYVLYIRIPITSIRENVRISNDFLFGGIKYDSRYSRSRYGFPFRRC